ncbi:substrate-binding domain-containing protein [Klebsiella sp. R445]
MCQYHVGLLFNANKAWDRQVIEGIGEYFAISECNWDIYIEESFCTNKVNTIMASADGIIADFDDRDMVKILAGSVKPYVGVGGSFALEDNYPQCDYVATDNYELVKLAFEHLMNKGIQRIVFFGLPNASEKRWATERENAYLQLAKTHFYVPELFQDYDAAIQQRDISMCALISWIRSLVPQSGIIAVTDSRARHLLQACAIAGVKVPDEIAIIGIDDEDLVNYLSRISLTTVVQGTRQIGFQAARLLHAHLSSEDQKARCRIVVPPIGIKERMSTDVKQTHDPLVRRALSFISENIHKPLKVIHVINYLGLSRTLIDSKFQKELGCKVHVVILKEKLIRCRILLENKNIPIADIPALVGFPSITYFYNFFTRQMNITPAIYRQHNAKE